MNAPSRKAPWIVGGVLLLMAAGVAATAAFLLKASAEQSRALPVFGQVRDFSLTNENGAPVSLATLRGHPWVADIIFTRCASQCPRMTRQMRQLQQALPPQSPVRLVSLTTDPTYDTPVILRRYAERFDADTNNWMFLTGTPAQIANLAVGSLKFSAVPTAPAERDSAVDLFVHSTIFVVVDQRGRMRGIFQTGGQGVNWARQKTKLLATLSELETGG